MSESGILSFVHLSDIHFNKYSDDPYDVDSELRSAVISDLKNGAREYLDIVNGVLVCGDLAFSGQAEEYKVAKGFLKEIIDIFEISFNDVFCVAGNHDVNQNVIKQSKIIEYLQDALISIDTTQPDNLDKEIRKIQNDKYVEGILYKPIANYNEHVVEMYSNYTVDRPNWGTELKLNDTYILSIYGMNSVLVSSHKDHLDENGNRMRDTERKMVISRKQIPERKDNVIYMSLCHHPPECWNNQRLRTLMDARVMIQLYGHKHIQKIEEGNNCIRIGSGALQPERGKDWIPRYNWIQVYVVNERLVVKIYPRIYEETKGIFVVDIDSCDSGKIYKEVNLNLRNDFESDEPEGEEIGEKDNIEIRTTNAITKEIVYRFTILSQHDKESVLRNYSQIDYNVEEDIDRLLKQLQENNLEKDFLEKIKN